MFTCMLGRYAASTLLLALKPFGGAGSVCGQLLGDGERPFSGVTTIRAQELCESRDGRPGLPVPNSLYGFCGRKATLNERRNKFWQILDECAGKRGSKCGDPHAACTLRIATVPLYRWSLAGSRTMLSPRRTSKSQNGRLLLERTVPRRHFRFSRRLETTGFIFRGVGE